MANDSWYNNLFDSGTNIWGAGGNGNTQKMIDAGLLEPDAKDKAQSQSLMRGLLGAGVSYISQPKNQNYGSAMPYIGKALGVGMEAAQKPFDNLATTASQNSKLNDMIAAKDKKAAVEKAKANLYYKIPGREQFSYNKDERLDVTDQDGNVTQVAPNMGQVNKSMGKTPDMEIFNPLALQDLAVKHPEAANEILENHKLQKEIETMGVAEGKETFRPATKEELEIYGAPSGQISMKTGKFSKTGSGPLVTNTNTVGGSEYDNVHEQLKANNKFLQTTWEGVHTRSADAAMVQRQTETAKALLQAAGDTGTGTNFFRSMDKVLQNLGFEGLEYTQAQIDSGDALTGVLNKLAIAQRPAASGVMTDNDFKVFQTMVGDFKNTKAANMFIQESMTLMARRKQEIMRKMMAYKSGQTSYYYKEDGSLGKRGKRAGELDDGLMALLDQESKVSLEQIRALNTKAINQFKGQDDELQGTGALSVEFGDEKNEDDTNEKGKF